MCTSSVLCLDETNQVPVKAAIAQILHGWDGKVGVARRAVGGHAVQVWKASRRLCSSPSWAVSRQRSIRHVNPPSPLPLLSVPMCNIYASPQADSAVHFGRCDTSDPCLCGASEGVGPGGAQASTAGNVRSDEPHRTGTPGCCCNVTSQQSHRDQ